MAFPLPVIITSSSDAYKDGGPVYVSNVADGNQLPDEAATSLSDAAINEASTQQTISSDPIKMLAASIQSHRRLKRHAGISCTPITFVKLVSGGEQGAMRIVKCGHCKDSRGNPCRELMKEKEVKISGKTEFIKVPVGCLCD